MAYLLPSSLQKRILRYALTRVELLDTDGLDLEKLDITWGKTSTIELRDIGIKIEKLSALLKLHQAFSISKARITTLRLTIPANLYQGNIVVEADGVDLTIRADSVNAKNAADDHDKPSDQGPDTQIRNVETDNSKYSSVRGHDPTISPNASESGEDEEARLPTTLDLAQSFMLSEPTEQRSELQAAVTQSLRMSQSLPPAANDLDASEVGMGHEISLPGFLAAYLKGVGDRIQVNLKNINLNLILRLPSKAELHSIEDVTIRVAMSSLCIGEVSGDVAEKQTRPVKAKHVQLVIISEQSLFSGLTKSSDSSSPETAQASVIFATEDSSPKPTSIPAQVSSSMSIEDNLRSHVIDDEASQGSVLRNHPSGLDESITTRTEPSIENIAAGENLATSSMQSDLFHSIADQSNLFGTITQRPRSPLSVIAGDGEIEKAPRRIVRGQGTTTQSSRDKNSAPATSDQTPNTSPVLTSNPVDEQSFLSAKSQGKSGLSIEDPSSTYTSGTPSPEDLTESKIFSHDQRESMYLSVLSGIPSDPDDDDDDPVPGGWKSSYVDDNRSRKVRNKDFKAEVKLGSHGKVEKRTRSDVKQSTSTVDYQTDEGAILGKSLNSEETAQRILMPSVDPRLGRESPVSEAPDGSPRSSGSLPRTPRDSTILAKRLLSIDSVILNLPCGNPETAARSFVPAGNHVLVDERNTSQAQYTSQTSSGLPPSLEKGHDLSQLATVIVIRNVQIVSDVGLTKLIISVAEKLSTICQPFLTRGTKSTSSSPKMSSRYTVTVDAISWKFVDLVRAVSVSDMTTLQTISSYPVLHEGAEVLLSCRITRLHLDRDQLEDHSRTKILVGNSSIGYADADILSFDGAAKIRKSSQDFSTTLDNDLRLEIVEAKGGLSIDVITRPVHMILDLRRLDETFSWFGGFSSMLDLGSSMISTVTLLDPNASRALPTKTVPRVVRFDTGTPKGVQRHGVPARSTKITARIEGLVFELQGVESGLRVESTAMKIVGRPEGLGGQIDRLKLRGPVFGNNDDYPPILAQLANIRLEYLSTPKGNDLDRLLTLLSPSNNAFGDEDDILVDTLLRQRKKGSVLRVTIENLDVHILDMPALQCIPLLMEEAKKLSTVAKYLPEDDRPGILTLLLVKSINAEAHIDQHFGVINLQVKNLELANITFPSLSALGILDLHLYRNSTEELFGEALRAATRSAHSEPRPMIMARFVGDEMEPTVKINIINARVEYYVTTIMSLMDLNSELAAGDLVSDMVSSVIGLTVPENTKLTSSKLSNESSSKKDRALTGFRALRFDVAFRDVVLGLNPLESTIKGLVVLTDAHLRGSTPNEGQIHSNLEIRKAELMIVDDITALLDPNVPNVRKNVDNANSQVRALSEIGYISISQISAMKLTLQLIQSDLDLEPMIEAEISNFLFVLESCADSTQTAMTLLKGLKHPTPKSTTLKYQTEIVPVEDMLASFSGDTFAIDRGSLMTQGQEAVDDDDGDSFQDDSSQNLEFVGSFYDADSENPLSESLGDSTRDEDLDSIATRSIFDERGDRHLSESRQEQGLLPTSSPQLLDIRENHFDSDSSIEGAAKRLDPRFNAYGPSKKNVQRNPLRLRLRDVHVIWNLFDGYDWQHTRDAISQAVAEVQTKAIERQSANKRKSFEPEEEDEDVIGDFLFNSIYIGIPAKSDPAELARQINHNIDDLASEAGSFSTSKSGKDSPSQALPTRFTSKQKLRLRRSKHHKMTFELKGVSADLTVFPLRSSEIESSLDIRVQDLEIFDHVPTSTWKKFATYMHDAGERESDACMIHIEILNVKPVPDLAASEIKLKASVLPLRLHVDQDALDFMTRFFDFKEDSASDLPSMQADAPFIQRAEIKSIRIRLDFKPKRVDYVGLRSGRSTEFMNFLVLDSADMVLRHSIVYGVSGFDRLGKTLNDIWMPDIKRNQLPGVLAGLAPVRSLVNVGGGMRDLFIVPIREYKKDGRVVRSFQKGAMAFAKTTTSELMRLGAKLAIGTQTILHGAEDILNQSNQSQDRSDITSGWDESDLDENEKKQISLYADQPIGVIQGLRGAYASLERDLLTARDAVVAMPGEVMESGTAGGAAKAVLRRAPTVILRPAMGVSMAVGQTLMGATNSLDPSNRRRMEDKYKKY